MISLLEDVFGSLVVSAGKDSDLGTVDNCEQHMSKTLFTKEYSSKLLAYGRVILGIVLLLFSCQLR